MMDFNEIGYNAASAIGGAVMASGNSFVMPVSHMFIAPVVAYATGPALAPVIFTAYAVSHGAQYAYKVFNEADSSTSTMAAAANALAQGAMVVGIDFVVGAAATNVAASKLAGDIGNLVAHSYDMIVNGKDGTTCIKVGMDISSVIFDIATPIGKMFDCYTAKTAFNTLFDYAKAANSGVKPEIGICSIINVVALKAAEISGWGLNCPASEGPEGAYYALSSVGAALYDMFWG